MLKMCGDGYLLLRKLEAYGFKSFADKTEVEFGRGVTAIVGPNGSGKSNISDAIRWALGEQSIRNLRGAKMEDVIFAGSSGRRPMGVAEVTLTFDNSDGSLPLDFNEVTITRRVFRSGDSEYFINKAHCRLKDIHDLLSNTGLGRDSMTIIGQNKIDEILNSKAEDRRLLFEDAAGITKYKQRKKEALRKLEDTRQNLVRVGDITTEIETQLVPLSQSAARTQQYNKLHNELITCQVTVLLEKLSKAEKMLESASLQKQTLTDSAITTSTRLTLKETDKDRLATELEQTDEAIAQVSTAISQAAAELERMDGQIGISNERVNQSKQIQKRLTEDQFRNQKQQQELQRQSSCLKDTITQKQLQEQQLTENLRVKTTQREQIIQSMNKHEQQMEAGKEQALGYLQALMNERNAIATAERDLTRLQQRHVNYAHERNEHNTQLTAARQLETKICQEQQAAAILQQQLKARQEQLTSRKADLQRSLQQSAGQETSLQSQLNEFISRRRILVGMQEEYEGFGRGIKSVLNSNEDWRAGICGAVGQILTVPDPYVAAIEIALGGAVQHIVTENDEIAKQAITFLKNHKLGRATFLPLTTVQPQSPREMEISASHAAGAVGLAADLVTYDKRYQKIADYLLGRIIIVDHIDTALRLAKQSSFRLKVVTLEGELLNPGGSMTGGSIRRRETSFLSRSNEIEKCKEKINDTKTKLAVAARNRKNAQRTLSELEAQLQSVTDEYQKGELRQAELEIRREKVHDDTSRISLAISAITAEIEDCRQEHRQLDLNLVQSKARVKKLESDDVKQQQSVQQWRTTLKEMQSSREQITAGITDDKVMLSALQQELSSLINTLNQYREDNAVIQAQLQSLTEEKSALEKQIAELGQEMSIITAKRTELANQKIQREQEYQQLYAKKAAVLGAMQQSEQELKELRRAASDLQNRLHEVELLDTKYNYAVTHCISELSEQYSLTVAEAHSLRRSETNPQLTAMIRDLEAEITELGPVNPAAIEEYQRLRERYQFLQKQCQDLVAAQDYLSSLLHDIDSTMAKQFSAALRKINEYFGDIFVKLFGGGKAHLALTDPQNMLETGIEIFVQPPGKKQQNLVSLSGGERALTVIALLFAFLTYRPAPFSVVDEIDAPLDEANLQRFSNFLREYSQHTQFIVVTHRKGTMEAADVMHGVTIEEAGVSRLVSVKFTEKAG
ncbi:MAG: chromosome segregation protein SMC [Veillonellales bacterium]